MSDLTTDPWIGASVAAELGEAEDQLAALVAVSSPSGDVKGAEAAVAACGELLPAGATVERPACSSGGHAPDLLVSLGGSGRRRLLLLGHLDTVIDHAAHADLRRDGDRLIGPGTIDMKGGVVLALGVLRALAQRPGGFAELALLLVVDEEWRTAPFAHAARFAGFDACLCFEAGERTVDGDDAVIVRRKAAGTLRVTAHGRAAHSGANPDRGANALLALADAARAVAAHHDPSGAERLTAVPTILRSGEAFNVVPAAGELFCDLRADRLEAFDPVLASIPGSRDGVRMEAALSRSWPGMDTRGATAGLLERAGARLGRRVVGSQRGGASDASHLASVIDLTVDGLGPRGAGAHTPDELVLGESLRPRAEVALAVALAALDGAGAGGS